MAAYNRPNSRLNIEDLKAILNTGQPTILAGDLNSKDQEWSCRTNNPNGSTLFNNFQNETWLLLAPGEPTYFPMQQNQEPDILDFALLNNMGFDSEQRVLNKVFSDYAPVLLEIKTNPQVVNYLKPD